MEKFEPKVQKAVDIILASDISNREQDVLKTAKSEDVEIETHGKVEVAKIYGDDGYGFKVVINNTETQKIGDIVG